MKKILSLKTKLATPLIIWFSITGIIWLLLNNYLFINGFVETKKANAIAQLEHLKKYHLEEGILSLPLEERVNKFRNILLHGVFEAKKVVFFDANGRVIYSTDEKEIDKTFPHLPLENKEFIKAFHGGIESAEFTYKEEEAGAFKNKLMVEVYSPLKINGETRGVIELWYSFETELAVLIKNLVILTAQALVILLFFWLLMGYALNRFVYKDFKNIYKAMDFVKKGDFSKKIESDGSKETNDLISFFNNLIDVVGDNQKKLVEAKESLEIKVKERTAELEKLKSGLEQEVEAKTKQLKEQLEQLERFKNETIGRELRMVELKREIEKLKRGSASNT